MTTQTIEPTQVCESCGDKVRTLHHGACLNCLLKASQALLNAAEDYRATFARLWWTLPDNDPQRAYVDRLYADYTRYTESLINWQEYYQSPAKFTVGDTLIVTSKQGKREKHTGTLVSIFCTVDGSHSYLINNGSPHWFGDWDYTIKRSN